MTPPEAFIGWVRQNSGVVISAQTETVIAGMTEDATLYRERQFFTMPDGGRAQIPWPEPIQVPEGNAYDPGYIPGQAYELQGANGDFYTNGARGWLAAEIINVGPYQWRLTGAIRYVDNAPSNNNDGFLLALAVMMPAIVGVVSWAAAGGAAASSGTAASAGWVSAEGGSGYAAGLAVDAAPVAVAAPETSIISDYSSSLAEPPLGANEVATTVVDWGPEISNFNALAAETAPAVSPLGNALQSAGAKLLANAAAAAAAAAIAPAAGGAADAGQAALLDPLQLQTAGLSSAGISPLLIVGLIAWVLLGQ